MKIIKHLDYQIDKKKYRNIFYDNIQLGQWHYTVRTRKELYWYQIMIPNDHVLKPLIEPVEKDLNIFGMAKLPRFAYQFPNTKVDHHTDDHYAKWDKTKNFEKDRVKVHTCLTSININLFDTIPTIHIEHQPYEYQCALINTGSFMHGVEPDPNPRLILKFCLEHCWDEVNERLKNYIKNENL